MPDPLAPAIACLQNDLLKLAAILHDLYALGHISEELQAASFKKLGIG